MKIVAAWELKNTLRAYSSSRTTRLPDGLQAAPFATQGLRLLKLVLPTMGSHALAIPASTPSSRTWRCPVCSTGTILHGRRIFKGRRRLFLSCREVSIQTGAICRQAHFFDKPVDPWLLVAQLHGALCSTDREPPRGPLRRHFPVAWHQGMCALAPSSRFIASCHVRALPTSRCCVFLIDT